MTTMVLFVVIIGCLASPVWRKCYTTILLCSHRIYDSFTYVNQHNILPQVAHIHREGGSDIVVVADNTASPDEENKDSLSILHQGNSVPLLLPRSWQLLLLREHHHGSCYQTLYECKVNCPPVQSPLLIFAPSN
jgi:hypothetical protein